MFSFFKFESLSKHKGDAEAQQSTHFHSTRSDSPNTLELATLVLSDTMRRNRIPKDWLRVECFDVVRRPDLKETHLQLVMQRWSEQLVHYSAAIQQQLVAGLDHFEPSINHSGYVFSWRYASDCVLPSALIPEGVAWHVSAHASD
jgi:hypothetical protein